MHRHFTAAGSVLMSRRRVKKGFVYGKTADERPCTTIEHPMPVEDLHATIFHVLGIPADPAYIDQSVPSTSRGTARARSWRMLCLIADSGARQWPVISEHKPCHHHGECRVEPVESIRPY